MKIKLMQAKLLTIFLVLSKHQNLWLTLVSSKQIQRNYTMCTKWKADDFGSN